MLRLLDRYVFVEWLKAFAMALLATLGLLLVVDIQDNLPDFLAWGATTQQILTYYALLVPTFLPLLVPIALLVSVLFALGNLHRRNEIVAMRASGLRIWGMTRGLVLAATMLAGGVFYLNAVHIPETMEQARTLRLNIRFAKEAERMSKDSIGLIKTLTFDNRNEGRLWVMNRFSEYTFQGYGVTVYLLDNFGKETGRVMARKAIYNDTAGYWEMVEGRELSFNPLTREVVSDDPFDKRDYRQFKEPPSLMKMLSKPASDLSFREVAALLDAVPASHNEHMRRYAVRYHAILASPFVCLVAVAVGIPFAVSGVRVNPVVNVAKAAGVFFGFYALVSLCQLLGGQGRLEPWVAAWLPHMMALGAAVYLWRRAES